jgi:hypothetical protein
MISCRSSCPKQAGSSATEGVAKMISGRHLHRRNSLRVDTLAKHEKHL